MSINYLLKAMIVAVVAACASSYSQPNTINGVRPALASRQTVVLNLHPDQAAALEDAAEEYIKACHVDDEDCDDAMFTGRSKSAGTTKTGATASKTAAAKPTASFAFARTLLSRVTSRPQPPFAGH